MKLSILIRNLNEAALLKQTLLSLKSQVTDFDYEIIVVDNESDDDSIEVAKSFNCRIISIPRKEFTYGGALNIGFAACAGEIILILSSHIILMNELFLHKIPTYFSNIKIAALRFIEVSNKYHLQNSLREGVTTLCFNNSKNFLTTHWSHFTVNHCAAISKKAWEETQYDAQLIAGEDKAWALEILKKGWEILYNVPLFYLYNKPFSRESKIKYAVIDELSKEKITGIPSQYRGTAFSLKRMLLLPLRKMKNEIALHKEIARRLKVFDK